MLRANRPPCYAENRLNELLSLDRELTREERRDLSLFRKRVRQYADRRQRYATDPDYRRREIDRNTQYWREHQA